MARKFEIKNTIGYRLCAFLDADTPLEIFRRLVIGSEGTLAFVAEAAFETVPLRPPHDAGADQLRGPRQRRRRRSASSSQAGATRDRADGRTDADRRRLQHAGNARSAGRSCRPTSAALLVEFRADDEGELDEPEQAALEIVAGRPTIGTPAFTRDAHEIELLWRVREGMQGLLAALRPPGVTMIIEDICVAPERVATVAKDLQALLGKHGFLPGVAGHASAGNLHFMLTPNFSEAADRRALRRVHP